MKTLAQFRRFGPAHSMVVVATLLASCETTAPSSALIAVKPMCTVLCEVTSTDVSGWNGQIFVSERTDSAVDHGFTAFRSMANPRGSTDRRVSMISGTGVRDTYGISEAWLQEKTGVDEIYRAQATPAFLIDSGTATQNGSSWTISFQRRDGVWRERSGSFDGSQIDDPETAATTVPQLMPVGYASPLMFACAGVRTADGTERTTALYEVTSTTGIKYLQDVLNGDDKGYRWSDGLLGPNILPMVSGPGDPIRKGIVQCAMVQQGEDATSRELHMIAIANGVLYHATASNFSPVQTVSSSGGFSRFHTVSGWGDVGAVLGGGHGTITSAAVVAHPSSISIFFVAETSGVYRLWHTVRFSSDGSWRPVREVLALSGDLPSGSAFPIFVSAGICPQLGATVWDQSTTETLIALRGRDPLLFPSALAVRVVRVVQTAKQWSPLINGFYSPSQLIPIGTSLSATNATGPRFLMRRVVVAARPFSDNAKP